MYAWINAHLTHIEGQKVKPLRIHIATAEDGSRIVIPGRKYDELADTGALDEFVRAQLEDDESEWRDR